MRNSEMIMYFYYKNMVSALPQFLFCLYNAWSGQTIFDDFYITFYNLAFTALPVIVRAILDQDIYYKKYKNIVYKNNELRNNYHHLYYVGQQNQIFDKKIISLWIIKGVMTAVIVFYLCLNLSESFMINSEGQNMNLWFFSITIYTVVIMVVDLKILFFTRFFSWISFASVLVFSLGIYIAYIFISNQISNFYVYKTARALLTSLLFYLVVFLISGVAIIFDVFILVMEREIKTPLYLMFKSLLQKKNVGKKGFEVVVQ